MNAIAPHTERLEGVMYFWNQWTRGDVTGSVTCLVIPKNAVRMRRAI
jgi:hypothetical protein